MVESGRCAASGLHSLLGLRRDQEHMPTFIGIDLAWQSDKNHSGGAVLEGDQTAVALREVSSGLCSLADVEAFIDRNVGPDTVVAVDAPLVIKNFDGQRPCETEIGRQLRRCGRERAHVEPETLPQCSQRAVCQGSRESGVPALPAASRPNPRWEVVLRGLSTPSSCRPVPAQENYQVQKRARCPPKSWSYGVPAKPA